MKQSPTLNSRRDRVEKMIPLLSLVHYKLLWFQLNPVSLKFRKLKPNLYFVFLYRICSIGLYICILDSKL